MRLVTQTALGVFALDQATKILVVRALDLWSRQHIAVLPPWLTFRMAWHQGINFGLLSSDGDLARWGLILMALGISAWVWLWVRREPHSRIVKLSAGCLIGGAMGNVVDRLLYGAVADFLNMSVPGFENPYSFNVADIAIFGGALGLVVFTGRGEAPGRAGRLGLNGTEAGEGETHEGSARLPRIGALCACRAGGLRAHGR